MDLIFLATFALVLLLYLSWGVIFLPAERWQILATVPAMKRGAGDWHGVNFTWYGLLTANAYLVAVAVLLVLLGALGVSSLGTAMLVTSLLCCCVPASRLVAKLVEKKTDTFTVGGAVFVGILVTPPVTMLLNRTAGFLFNFHITVMGAYTAIAIAYAFGEGLGRLACISFGCCYGKPLHSCSAMVRRLFAGHCFVFHGQTKKITYAGGMEATEVIPIQAITALVCSSSGLVATWLFLSSHQTAAFLLATVSTQVWRILSETMRADHRGGGNFSTYQFMGIVGLLYALCAAWFFRGESQTIPDLAAGLESIWRPELLLFLQAIWLVIFLYTGRSTVTGAILSFHVHRDRI